MKYSKLTFYKIVVNALYDNITWFAWQNLVDDKSRKEETVNDKMYTIIKQLDLLYNTVEQRWSVRKQAYETVVYFLK